MDVLHDDSLGSGASVGARGEGIMTPLQSLGLALNLLGCSFVAGMIAHSGFDASMPIESRVAGVLCGAGIVLMVYGAITKWPMRD